MLMGVINKVRRWEDLGCHETHTKFHIDWFKHSQVDTGEFTDTERVDFISLLLIFQEGKYDKTIQYKILIAAAWAVTLGTVSRR
jgi:hypothetical protein